MTRRRTLGVLAIVGVGACQHEPADAPVTVHVPLAEPTGAHNVQDPPPNPRRPGSVESGADEPMPNAGPHGTQPFDKDGAVGALGSADLSRCYLPGGPSGNGHATITFDPSGRVSVVAVDAGPFVGTPIGDCVAKVYSTITVLPFAGAPTRVGKSFAVK